MNEKASKHFTEDFWSGNLWRSCLLADHTASGPYRRLNFRLKPESSTTVRLQQTSDRNRQVLLKMLSCLRRQCLLHQNSGSNYVPFSKEERSMVTARQTGCCST
uniref:Uncharacterized protein n=1 Tax=Haemonchus contortus TaxID=6289 RepID=A0A7I4Z0K9_HAECO